MKKCRSSFVKKIEEIPGIAVDNFENEHLNSRAFFLSHYHMDHIQGLHSKEFLNHLERTNAYIYTTEITVSIIYNKIPDLKYPEILKYLKPLGRETTLITLPSMQEKDLEELFVEVTLIPAGHCLGSTMFLFKTTEKTVLYTGDFRIRINDISKYGQLHINNEPIHIDALYVDTTFIGKEFEDFAKRTDTADTVIEEIDNWLKTDKNHAVAVYLFANYTFEFMLNKIYQKLNMKVYINEEKWNFYSTMLHLVPGVTNDPNETRIHLCRNRNEGDHYHCLPYDICNMKFLYIHLTAYKWNNFNLDESPILRKTPTWIDACFATHCSRNEILHFVSYFNPSKVVGFPHDYVKPVESKNEEFFLTPKKKLSSTKKRQNENSVSKESLLKVVKKIF